MELNREVFEDTIVQTDSALAKAKIPILARPIQAIIAIFKKYNVSGPISNPSISKLEFPVGPLNLCVHINSWYEGQYGNKIKIDPSPGRFPLVIEGATYQCRIPLVSGTALILSSKSEFKDKQILNAIDHITDLPKIVRARLSGESENYIQSIFCTCIEVSKELSARRTPLHESSQSDILIGNNLLCGHNINASMSAWHSLQLAEKVLKQYISEHEEPPHIHDIKKLIKLAKKYGYTPDNSLNLSLFNFGAKTRYKPKQISVEQAVKINHEAWRISFNVLKHA